MDQQYGQPVADQEDDGGLAAARLHVQALTEKGLSPEALLQALLERCPPSQAQSPVTSSPAQTTPPASDQPSPASTTTGPTFVARHEARLSIATANSASTASTGRSRNSVMSMATSVSSTSSHGSTSRFSQVPGTQQFNSRPSTRAYWCTSCPQKLQRKFDWKRHEDEFHERYKKYPCPDCNRVFWGANTFNQHHKSRHACTTCPHADKVVRYSKRKRAWGCGFCAAFLPSLERYFDHVAMHYESGKTKAHWDHALVVYGLLHQPVVYDAWKQLKMAKYGDLPREQQPKISWDPRNTGRAHGFLENENPGQLQDLLEFFDPARDNVEGIVALAWDQAIFVTQASYDPRHPIDAANVRRPSEPMVQGLPQQQDQQQQQQQAAALAAAAGAPPPPQMAPPPPPQQQQAPPPLDTRPLPQRMSLDRPLPTPSFEQAYYSPVSVGGVPVEYPSAAALSPLPQFDFAPFEQSLSFQIGGNTVGGPAGSMGFNDWSSLATTMVEDPMGDGANGGGNGHHPDPRYQQQQQQIQLQQPPDQQQYWQAGLFPSHTPGGP